VEDFIPSKRAVGRRSEARRATNGCPVSEGWVGVRQQEVTGGGILLILREAVEKRSSNAPEA